MEWTALGHATWLCEVAGLRILCDPLLADAHYGGVFTVSPPREIVAEALRPDFVFVSHRHPDHFDLLSLRRLAELDADTVLVTPDPLVARAAARLGFRTVREVAAEVLVELDGARLLTTPSAGATTPECGLLVEGPTGVAYNQVDTCIGSPAAATRFFDGVARVLGREPDGLVSLHLARWQPLLEVNALVGGAIGFPFAAYARELDHAASVGATALVPSAAGARHAAPFEAMNRLVYPVTERRFLDDAAARLPRTRVLPFVTGGAYTVEAGEVSVDHGGGARAGLVAVRGAAISTDFRPLEVPPLVDPYPAHGVVDRVAAWVRGPLAAALPRTSPSTRFALEVALATGRVAFTLEAGAGGVRVTDGVHPEWDARCEVAGSMLCDVLDARRHWGELLLSGSLRGVSRGARVEAIGLTPSPLQALFVYYAIGYEESFERAVDRYLDALT